MCVCVFMLHISYYIIHIEEHCIERERERDKLKSSGPRSYYRRERCCSTMGELRVSRRIEFSGIHSGLVSGGIFSPRCFVFGGNGIGRGP